MKKITQLNSDEALKYFLKEESYFDADLPKYFTFKEILNKTFKKIEFQPLSDFYGSYTDDEGIQKPTFPWDYENVNYKLLSNKDGKYAWRPFQLIHPAIYISLVQKITLPNNWKLILEKFEEFSSNSKIRCYSLPLASETKQSDQAVSITNWWYKIEQQSLELGLKYNYVLHTDIADCYGSIYTHSIPWALHTKPVAKKNKRKKNLLGNIIDTHLQNMSFGQTNGIPQGSVLMDFIAEVILGYVDLLITEKIKTEDIVDYEILRYRDDYRIFSNNPRNIESIAKILSDTLAEIGLKINSQKTFSFNNIISSSIKPDKIYWNQSRQGAKDFQKHLLIIYNLSLVFPNSGSLSTSLSKFHNRIKKTKKIRNPLPIISILVEIMTKNPRVYPISTAILSKLLTSLETYPEKEKIINLILLKFNKIPNTGHLKIWLQRLTLKANRKKEYDESLCRKVNNNVLEIWNSDWLNDDFKNIINKTSIVDEEIIEKMETIISSEEVELFKSDYDKEPDKSKPNK